MSAIAKAGLAVGVVVLGVGAFFAWRHFADTLAGKLAEAKAMGLPTTPAEITANMPDSQNGAIEVNKAIHEIEASPSHQADTTLLTKALAANADDSDRQSALEVVSRLKPELELVIAATKKPHCQFPINWSDVLHVRLLPDVYNKVWVKAICVKAENQCRRGDTAGALNSILMAHRVSRLLADNPMLINLLVQIACEAILERSFDRMIGTKRRDARFLAAAEKMHDSFGRLPNYRFSLKTELVYDLASIDQLKSLKDEGIPALVDTSGLGTATITPSDRAQVKAHVLGMFNTLFKALPKTDTDWEAIHSAAAAANKTHQTSDPSLSKVADRMVSLFSAVGWDDIIDAEIRCQVHRQLTDLALALFLMKAQGKRFPQSLASMGKKAIDPFSGHEFIYKPEGPSFTLYGVGKNRIDDGGDATKDDVLTLN